MSTALTRPQRPEWGGGGSCAERKGIQSCTAVEAAQRQHADLCKLINAKIATLHMQGLKWSRSVSNHWKGGASGPKKPGPLTPKMAWIPLFHFLCPLQTINT
eukprot:1145576-Pelagomonas_calceolata.AAC.3